MESSIDTPAVCVSFTEDEFLTLVAILHSINWQTGREDKSFRSLILKLYEINLHRAVMSLESWTDYALVLSAVEAEENICPAER